MKKSFDYHEKIMGDVLTIRNYVWTVLRGEKRWWKGEKKEKFLNGNNFVSYYQLYLYKHNCEKRRKNQEKLFKIKFIVEKFLRFFYTFSPFIDVSAWYTKHKAYILNL